MLKPEIAKQRLESWKAEAEDRFLSDVMRFPANLRTIGYGLLNRDAKGKEFEFDAWSQRQETVAQAIRPIEKLPVKDRKKLFDAFFGGLAPAIETAWQFLKRSTYQQGYTRKSFRVPDHPEVTLDGRLSWLIQMIGIARRFKPEVLTAPWLAAWAPHLEEGYGGSNQENIGRLLAAVIDAGGPTGEEVFDILCQSIRNEHEIGGMGRHVTRGLLMASRSDGWELIEKTLLAAQRQEGLRQAILETVDETHPEAFRRMLRLIRDHDLARFSAVVRAVDVWLGFAWDSVSVKVINQAIDRAIDFLDNPKARQKALAGSDPEAVYQALWAIAFEDAIASIPVATELLKNKRVEIRFVAALHLANLALEQTHAARAAALDDEDLRVADCALSGIPFGENQPDELDSGDELFERLERLFRRVPPKPLKLKPLIWPWTGRKVSQGEIAGRIVQALGDRPPTVLIPYLPAIDPWRRSRVVQQLAAQKKWNELTRQTLLRMAGDASSDVRQAALESLAKVKLQPDEVERLEALLTRKTSDLRQGVLGLLLKQSDALALESAERLAAAREAMQRLAGLEVLREMAVGKRRRDECIARAESYRASRRKMSKEEQNQIDAILGSTVEQVTLDNALGLMDAAERSPAVPPEDRKAKFLTDAAVACIHSLDELVHAYRETPIKYKSWQGEKEELLGNVQWGFPSPPWGKPVEKGREALPLGDLWEQWYADRPKSQRDQYGRELLRADVWLEVAKDDWDWKQFQEWGKKAADRKKVLAALSCGFDRSKLKYPALVDELIDWMLYLHSPPEACNFLLDAVETTFTLVPPSAMAELAKPKEKGDDDFCDDESDWRSAKPFSLWFGALHAHLYGGRAKPTPEQAIRRWQLMRWMDEPFPGATRSRPDLSVLAAAYDHKAATLADIADHLLGPKRSGYYKFASLSSLTERKLGKDDEAFLARHAEVRDLVEKCRARIVEIELARGETVTAATALAWEVKSLWGTDLVIRLMTGLGKQGFKVPTGWRHTGSESKVCTLTQLTKVTYPRAEETPELFVRLADEAVGQGLLVEKQFLELAFLAPQWGRHVECHLGWPGFSEALYWFLAHMRDTWDATAQAAVAAGIEDEADEADEEATDADSDSDDADEDHEKPSAWDRLIAERTPLSARDRQAGAVDVGWFRRIYDEITPKRWQAMAEAAKFAANAAQARRAQFLADVLTGKAKRKDLIDGVRKKKLKDYVRLLGLYPLAEGAKRATDLNERYHVLQEYRRYAKTLSAMTKPEALRSVEIGMQNLANTAGFPDPLRMEWAMEADQVKDLARGPVSATKGDVTVTLSLDDQSRPQIAVQRAGKPIKSIPPAVKKDKRIAALAERAADLKRQAPRMRASLEAAMCRGDVFSGAELGQLCQHAILAPLLGRLVLVGEGIMGYPDKGGRVLRNAQGKFEPVKKGESLRIAHAHDLLESEAWEAYQRECFQAERMQPFKQLFRELYVVTKQEKRSGAASHRYAGQQVQPKQAFALWGHRGWHTQDGVWKMFHDLGLTASVSFKYGGGTALDVEGLTLETVEFRKRDELKPLRLADVPPRVFSEVMRDVDLVVSVAHRGGVDPDASASTVEMRASLLRETCDLLGLENVCIKNTHAMIDGQLANYSVHLGSATVHRLPGGSVCVVAVGAQHRGRLFLPFADDDPRTAEVLSKVILLARDSEIQDPTILDQLRH